MRRISWLVLTSYEKADYAAMLRYAEEWSGILKSDSAVKMYGRDMLAWALMKNGDSKRAYKLLVRVKNDISTVNDPFQQSQYDYALGLLAFEEESYDLAVKQFDASFEIAYPNRAGQFHYGVALLKAGRVAEAIIELQKASRRLMLGTSAKIYLGFLPTRNYWLVGTVKAHYWLGVAYEEQGEKEKAIKEYKTFLDIWKDADFDSPELNDAKIRVDRLEGEVPR